MTCLNTELDGYLHEEASDESLPDVDVIVATAEVCAGATQVEAVHDAGQLLSHIVSTLHGPVVDEVVICPLRVIMVCWTTRSQLTVTFPILFLWPVALRAHSQLSHLLFCHHGLLDNLFTVNCHIYYSVIMVCWPTS